MWVMNAVNAPCHGRMRTVKKNSRCVTKGKACRVMACFVLMHRQPLYQKCRLVIVKSSAANGGSPTGRVLASTTSLLTNELFNVLVSLGSAYTGCEVAADLILEL